MANEKSKTCAMLESNKIMEAWPFKNGDYCLSVTPAVPIDRIKFSFFPKGQKGKNGFDIYVDGLAFYQLIVEMKKTNCLFKEKWQFVTGANGSKKLSLENGRKAYVVCQASDSTKDKYATVGLNKEQIWGLINLYDIFVRDAFIELWKTSYDIGKKGYHKEELSQEDEVSNNAVDVSEENQKFPEDNNTQLALTSANEITERDNGLFTLICQDVENNDIQVVFNTGMLDNELFEKFKNRLKEKGSINFSAKGKLVEKGGHKRLIFESFA